jgi:beta-glucanase (GH16 family)
MRGADPKQRTRPSQTSRPRNWGLWLAASLLLACGAGREPKAPSTDGAVEPSTDAAVEQALPPTFTRDGVHYELAWVEAFEDGLGEASLGDWTFDSNAAWLHPDNVVAEGGKLVLWLTERGDREVPSGQDYLGAEYGRTGMQLHGRLLTRMRPAAPAGVIASFFTGFFDFDEDGRLRETAEIDIELVGTTRQVQFALHWVDARGVKQTVHELVPLAFDAGDAFRVWEIEWLPSRVAFYVDGQELHRFTDPDILAELSLPQQVRANTWISTSVPWAGVFDPASLPVASRYDWIASYRLAE